MDSLKPENAGNSENERLIYLVWKLLLHTVEVEKCRVEGDLRNDNNDNFKLLTDCFNTGLITETEEAKEKVMAALEQLILIRQFQTRLEQQLGNEKQLEQKLGNEKQLEQKLRQEITRELSSLECDRKIRREFELWVSFRKAKAMNPEIRRSIVELEKMNTWGPIWKEFLRSLFKW